MSRRMVGDAPFHATPPPAVTEKVLVTADEIADMVSESIWEMIEFTTFRIARSIAAPPRTFRAISSSVSRTFWPHFWTAAIAAVPVGLLAYGYSDPGATDSTGRSVRPDSPVSYMTAPPTVRNRPVSIWSEANRRSL